MHPSTISRTYFSHFMSVYHCAAGLPFNMQHSAHGIQRSGQAKGLLPRQTVWTSQQEQSN
eukprot:213480-Chlamydomonas_euryale.AAC.3